jgi:hypothetical protein
MYDEKYEPCEKREKTKQRKEDNKESNEESKEGSEDGKKLKKYEQYQNALLFYKEFCTLFEEVMSLPEYQKY